MSFDDFPSITNLGEHPKFKEYGLSLRSHKNSQVRLIGNQAEIEIGYEKPVRTLATLKSVDKDKEAEDSVFIQYDDHVIRFVVTIPEKGFWKLELYALPTSEEGEKLLGVFTYLLHCPKVIAKHYPYPKRYKQWSDGCFLYDPLILHKDVRGGMVHFKIKVPNANDVAVCINNEQPWTHLKDEHKRNVFEGNVKLADHYGRKVPVTVNARYGEDKGSSYTTLLQYTI